MNMDINEEIYLDDVYVDGILFGQLLLQEGQFPYLNTEKKIYRLKIQHKFKENKISHKFPTFYRSNKHYYTMNTTVIQELVKIIKILSDDKYISKNPDLTKMIARVI